MRDERLVSSVKTIGLMETVSKSSKPHTHKHATGINSKHKQKERGVQQRRYSLDIVSSKPLNCHILQHDRHSPDRAEERRVSHRRYSVCGTKLDHGKSKDILSENRHGEMKSILKSGISSLGSSSIHSLETESSTGSGADDRQSSEVKCSYRLPKTSEKSKLRKCVSFREDDTSTKSTRRRFSSPPVDISSEFSLSASTLY